MAWLFRGLSDIATGVGRGNADRLRSNVTAKTSKPAHRDWQRDPGSKVGWACLRQVCLPQTNPVVALWRGETVLFNGGCCEGTWKPLAHLAGSCSRAVVFFLLLFVELMPGQETAEDKRVGPSARPQCNYCRLQPSTPLQYFNLQLWRWRSASRLFRRRRRAWGSGWWGLMPCPVLLNLTFVGGGRLWGFLFAVGSWTIAAETPLSTQRVRKSFGDPMVPGESMASSDPSSFVYSMTFLRLGNYQTSAPRNHRQSPEPDAWHMDTTLYRMKESRLLRASLFQPKDILNYLFSQTHTSVVKYLCAVVAHFKVAVVLNR